LVLNHDDKTWDYPKGEVLGKKRLFLNMVFGEKSERSYKYL
jgi:hypothetical protein